MHISNLQLAKNTVQKPSPLLTQYTSSSSEKVVTEGKVIRDSVELSSLASSDNEYTKQDAILSQWNKQFSFNLYDVMDGKTTAQGTPVPSSEELNAFKLQLRETGISDEIDWSNLEFDFRGIGFDSEKDVSSIGLNDFMTKTDYLASRYAVLCERINNTYSGEVRKEQLGKLNQFYNTAVEDIARGYSDIVGDFLEKNGVCGETEKIYHSVIVGVNQKAQDYQSYINKNRDYDGLIGTDDEWLLNDDEYMAAVLSKKDAEVSSPKGKRDAVYTLNDVNALGQYASDIASYEKKGAYCSFFSTSEEMLGLDFAMLSMKTDYLQKNGGLTEDMNTLLQRTQNGFINGIINRIDEMFSDNRKSCKAIGDKIGFSPLNREIIWDVYNCTMTEYKTTENVMQSFLKGVEYGKKIYMENMSKEGFSEIYRYNNSQNYWNNFFSVAKEKEKGNVISPNYSFVITNEKGGSYVKPLNTYQQYINSWTQFEESVGGDMDLGMNMRSYVSCC